MKYNNVADTIRDTYLDLIGHDVVTVIQYKIHDEIESLIDIRIIHRMLFKIRDDEVTNKYYI